MIKIKNHVARLKKQIILTTFGMLIFTVYLNSWIVEPNPLIDTEDTFSNNSLDRLKVEGIVTKSLSEQLPDNNTWKDFPLDYDDNGLYDKLVVNLGSLGQISQEFYLYGLLKNSSGSWLGLSHAYIDSYSKNNISIYFAGQPINASGSDGQYEVWIATFTNYSPNLNFTRMYTTTNSYNHNNFESPSATVIAFSDYGSDLDADSLFDEIIITVSISVRDSGYYTAGVLLGFENPFTTEGQTFLQHWSGDLNPGIENVEISFPTYYFYSEKLNGPYTVGFAYLSTDYGDFQHFLTNAYNTSDYLYTDFDIPAVLLTGDYWDKGEDIDGDGKYDKLVIDTGVNVTEAGNYRLELSLTPSEGIASFDLSGDSSGYWNKGVHNVSVSIDATHIFSQRLKTSYVISYIRIYDSYDNTLDQAFRPYTTRVYDYKEFDAPTAFLTGNFWDWGADTDFDSKFDQLLIIVEINVTQTGEYNLYLRVRANATGDSFYEYPSGSWAEGVHNISIVIDVNSFYSQRVNTSFMVEYAQIRDSYYNTIDQVYDPYTTRIYNYIEFDTPVVYLTGNYWDKGLDTDENGKFDKLVFDVEINVTQTGDYSLYLRVRANVTGDSFYEYPSGSWAEGVHNVSVVITINSYYSQRVNTSYVIEYVRIYDSYYNTIDQVYTPYNTRLYYYNEFDVPSTFLTGNYWDRGLDTDADGKFDELIIDMEVNVTQAGDYTLELRLRSDIISYEYWGSTSGSWIEGLYIISVSVDAESFYYQRLNTSYVVEYIRISNSSYALIERLYSAYTTRVYDYSEFDLPAAYLIGKFWDRSLDTDADGKFDRLVIDLEVNVTVVGDYTLELRLRSSVSGYSYYLSTSGSWIEGLQTISVSIDASSFYSQRENTSYMLEYVYIYNSSYYTLDRLYPDYLTRLYNYTEFDSPAVYLTGIYWDKGLDIDANGKFDQLVIDTEVNVTEAGNFTLELRLRSSASGYNYYRSASGFWNEGLHNISVTFDTISFYPQKLNTSYVVEYVRIYNSSYFTLDRLYPYYNTRLYNYTEFDLPPAFLTGNYWDRGLDTDTDSTFDQLVIDIEVNVTESGEYSLYLSLRSASAIYQSNSISGFWDEEIQNISVGFETGMFFLQGLNESYEIQEITIHDSSYNLLDRSYYPYTTRVYNFTEFDEVDAPIYIYGNEEFQATAIARKWPGDGSSSAPYVIDGLVLSGTYNLIEIRYTDVYFQISNCIITNGDNGIYLYNVKNGYITGNTITSNYNGIRLSYSDENIITDNEISENQNRGIYIYYSGYNYISTNLLDGNGGNTVHTYGSNNNTFIQNTISNGGNWGINLDQSSDNNIIDNIVNNHQAGIVLWRSNSNMITNNNVSDCIHEAIGLHYVTNTNILENLVVNNGAGIILYDSSQDNVITGNDVHNNNVEGIGFHPGNNDNIISENSVYRNSVGVTLSQSSSGNFIEKNTIYDNTGHGISLSYANDNTIAWNTMYNNEFGIWMEVSNNVGIFNNTITKNNGHGIWAHLSDEILIENNIFSFNDWDNINFLKCTNSLISYNIIHNSLASGILFENSDSNIITSNLIYDNEGQGIRLVNWWNGVEEKSDNNRIEFNDITGNNNGGQAVDDGQDNIFISNYWSDWSSTSSYTIDGDAGNQDLSPLTNPFHLSVPAITAPTTKNFAADTVTIQWLASADIFGHSITYAVFYSTNDGASWTALVSGLTSSTYKWDITSLADGTKVRLKVQATDSIGFKTISISPTEYTIVKPTVTISSSTTSITTTTTEKKQAPGFTGIFVLLAVVSVVLLIRVKHKVK